MQSKFYPRPAEKVGSRAGDANVSVLPSQQCKACRRPTITSICGTCRRWHAYLSAVGSLRGVR